jgi:hypothetical protein
VGINGNMTRQAAFRQRQLNLLLLAAIDNEISRDEAPFRKKLAQNSRRLQQGKIRRGALLAPAQSPFKVLFISGQNDVLDTLCGFDHASFESLHAPFCILFDNHSPYSNKGRNIWQHNRNKKCLTIGHILSVSVSCSCIGVDQDLWPFYSLYSVSLLVIYLFGCALEGDYY